MSHTVTVEREDRVTSPSLIRGTSRTPTDLPGGTPSSLKYLSLVLLTAQNAMVTLVMRYVRTRDVPMFMATGAVVMSEILKCVSSLGIIYYQMGSFQRFVKHLHENIVLQPGDCLKVSIPSLVYTLQNNLLYVALSNLDAATFQVTYQLKILTTAVFSVIMLGKRLSIVQWISLVILFTGISIVQMQPDNAGSQSEQTEQLPLLGLPNKTWPWFLVTYQLKILTTAVFSVIMLGKRLSIVQWISLVILFTGISIVQMQPDNAGSQSEQTEQRPLLGLVAVIVSCLMSGFAGVYFEKILKGTKQSVWLRNVQLGFLGSVIGFVTMMIKEGDKASSHGFFYGYDALVWLVIALQSLGGLLVAVVVKYADNILKGFATSLAIVISCIVSVYFFEFNLSLQFIIGASLVMLSIYLYGKYIPPPPIVKKNDNENGKVRTI